MAFSIALRVMSGMNFIDEWKMKGEASRVKDFVEMASLLLGCATLENPL